MRIVSENAINPMAFLSDQCQSWMKNGGLDLGLIDQSTLMFYFEESEKLETVLKRAPRNFDNHLLVIQHVLSSTYSSSLMFDTSPQWIQLCDLSMDWKKEPIF